MGSLLMLAESHPFAYFQMQLVEDRLERDQMCPVDFDGGVLPFRIAGLG